MRIVIAVLALLSGCDAPKPQPVGVTLQWSKKQEIRPVRPAGLRTEPNQTFEISPPEVIRDAVEVKQQGREYVYGEGSKPDKIKAITKLSEDMNNAIMVMNNTRASTGHYKQSDVKSLKHAVEALRHFLATKGD